MSKKNCVFIATSLDGYIADKNGGLDWLSAIPNPDNDDMGYLNFMSTIDAIVMGRLTFETVIGFDVPWPYEIPVFVLSNKMKEIPPPYQGKAHLLNSSPSEILSQIHKKGYERLYIDGGTTIHNFLKADLIDEMTLTTFPILLGGGASLFADLPKPLMFRLTNSKVYLDQIIQHHYQRIF